MRKLIIVLALLLLPPVWLLWANDDVPEPLAPLFWDTEACDAYDFAFTLRNDDFGETGYNFQAACNIQLGIYPKGERQKPLQTLDMTIPLPVNENGAVYNDGDSIGCIDVNFDGHGDLVIYSGNLSAYYGPSYDIYLFNSATGRFERSPVLEELQLSGLGMFKVDTERQVLGVYSKSGCCTHYYEEYRLVENVPESVYFQEEVSMGEDELFHYYERELNDGQWQERRWSAMPVDY